MLSGWVGWQYSLTCRSEQQWPSVSFYVVSVCVGGKIMLYLQSLFNCLVSLNESLHSINFCNLPLLPQTPVFFSERGVRGNLQGLGVLLLRPLPKPHPEQQR